MDDDELIAAAAAGDDSALRELFSRHAPWLAARLRALLPAADVEDVLQETFLAVWRGAAAYRPEGAAVAWIAGDLLPAGDYDFLLYGKRRGGADELIASYSCRIRR